RHGPHASDCQPAGTGPRSTQGRGLHRGVVATRGTTVSGALNLFSAQGRAHGGARYMAPLLEAMAAQAPEADRTRSLSGDLIAEIKKTDLMRMSATPSISGLGASIVAMADELRAVAG